MIGGNRERAIDELPQSGAGRTIMTTQPKFIPNEAVEIELRDSAVARVRLVDCVGYLIPGVLGLNEGDESRMVRTPWFDHDIPFEDAAEIGTRKVIQEHSTIGVVITTDGSVVDMPRSAYKEAEERVVRDLLKSGEDSGLKITIGSENKFTGIQDCSMVQATYRLNGKIVGTMAVLGPTRMEYGKVISVMDYLHKYLKTMFEHENNK